MGQEDRRFPFERQDEAIPMRGSASGSGLCSFSIPLR